MGPLQKEEGFAQSHVRKSGDRPSFSKLLLLLHSATASAFCLCFCFCSCFSGVANMLPLNSWAECWYLWLSGLWYSVYVASWGAFFFFFFSYISSPLGLVGMENAGTNMPTRSLRLVLPNMSHLCIATRYITITVVICFFFFFSAHGASSDLFSCTYDGQRAKLPELLVLRIWWHHEEM